MNKMNFYIFFCLLTLALAVLAQDNGIDSQTKEKYEKYYKTISSIRNCVPGNMADVSGMMIIKKTKNDCTIASGKSSYKGRILYREICTIPNDKYQKFVDLHELNAKLLSDKNAKVSAEEIKNRMLQAHRIKGPCMVVD